MFPRLISSICLIGVCIIFIVQGTTYAENVENALDNALDNTEGDPETQYKIGDTNYIDNNNAIFNNPTSVRDTALIPIPNPEQTRRQRREVSRKTFKHRQEYYSEQAGDKMGKAMTQRQRRGAKKKKKGSTKKGSKKKSEDSNDSFALTNTVADRQQLLQQRVHDIEEIFLILARRDGQFLEQMLSVKQAVDRLYSIFEYLGVANLPPKDREVAVRKVVQHAFKIDFQKLPMQKRLRIRKFAHRRVT